MGAIIAFFQHLGEKSSPKNTKEEHLINIANLNYCGIMKSPFEFYSGKYQTDLEQLSATFQKLRRLYTPWSEDKPFAWQFAKLDKKIKDRYCPFYDINVGIQKGKFVSRKRFQQLWEIKMKQQEELTKSKFEGIERQETLIFDLLAFHTLLFKVFKILDVNQAQKYSTQAYLKEYTPYFAQSFLDQKKKLVQFKRGLEASYADIVFVQEPDELLIDDFKKFEDQYFISISPDKDTLIFAKKNRFNHQKQSKVLLDRLTPEQMKLLDWNKHTSIMFLDNYMLISGHLNSKKEQNAADVKDLVKIMPILLQKFLDFDIICGMDANSYIAPFDQRIHMFPNRQDQFTSIKKRTSMQVQSSKSEKMIKELKDAVMTTLPIQTKFVYTIDGRQPSQSEFLPLDDHPFDHYLVFVVVADHRK